MILVAMIGGLIAVGPAARSVPIGRDLAMRAAIHPVASRAAMQAWLGRVPVTRDFPEDFEATLRNEGPALVIEMSTSPGCLPCGDLWSGLANLGRRYGWRVRVLGAQDAMLRSGKLGLPWVGDPVAWVRGTADTLRVVPIAIGTDRPPNLARNMYLAAKMLSGVRPAVGVRAMSKFTGIVGMPTSSSRGR